MAEEQGQVQPGQPQHAIFQENLNPHDAVSQLAALMEKDAQPARDAETGRSQKKEEAKPEAEAVPEEPKAESQVKLARPQVS